MKEKKVRVCFIPVYTRCAFIFRLLCREIQFYFLKITHCRMRVLLPKMISTRWKAKRKSFIQSFCLCLFDSIYLFIYIILPRSYFHDFVLNNNNKILFLFISIKCRDQVRKKCSWISLYFLHLIVICSIFWLIKYIDLMTSNTKSVSKMKWMKRRS